MYGYLTPNELLTHFGKVYRMDNESIKQRIKKVLKTVRLQEWEHKKIEDFSTGMKRRLAIGLALLSDPQILLLDEPVMGLDPKGIKEIRELINSLSEKDITIFLSSHLLNEVSLTCDKVIFLFEGEIVAYDDVETIVGDAKHNRISVEFLDPLSEDEIDSLKTLKYIDKIRVDGNKVRIYNSGKKERMHKILTSLIDEGFEVVSFSYEKKDLEDLYISLAGKSDGGVR
ncbi:MAG: AAA family ATPase, partial [Thermoplasmata archaeon]